MEQQPATSRPAKHAVIRAPQRTKTAGINPLAVNLILLVLFSVPASSSLAMDRESANYPERPIRLVVPQSPGGATNFVGRLIASLLSDQLGEAIVVDNRPGAATIVGTELVARAIPDGYTLLMVPSSFAILPSIKKQLSFDPIKDFVPLTTLTTYPNVVLVRLSFPVNSIQQLISLAKAKPGSINFASGGVGTGTHLGAELFDKMAAIKMFHVPYKGGGPALNALVGGHVDLQFTPMPTALPLIRAGKLKGLAVSSAQRSPLLPDMPTVAESGVPGYEQITWNGLVAPAHVPPAIAQKLNVEVNEILRMPSTKDTLAASGLEPGGTSQKAFGAMIKREISKWGKLVREIGITPK